jgi:DNA-binding NarL/FixJ family response regulator
MPLTVLVVDDEPGIRLSVSDYLELNGYAVVTAKTGQEALNCIDHSQPHLLITDIMMPEMDGYKLVQQIRQQPSLRLLPVIFLTARSETPDRIRGYQLGCDAFLPKPFELNELGAVIRNLLDRVQIIQSSQWQQGVAPSQRRDPQESTRIAAALALYQQLQLTQREQEVLNLLTEGLSNALIGDRLHLSSRTIEKYVSRLLEKTSAHNRADLVRFAIQHDLCNPENPAPPETLELSRN